ncbi:MAG: hypothetical protein WA190_06585 [Usitatibacter sp.]
MQANDRGLIASIAATIGSAKPAAVVADVTFLESQGLSAAMFSSRLVQSLPHVHVFLRLPSRTGITRSERAWASGAGIASLLPGGSASAVKSSLAPVVARIVSALDVEALDAAPLDAAVNRLVKSGVEPRPGIVKDIYALAWQLERDGVDIAAAFEALRSAPGLVADRRYRGKVYPECFVASEAIDFMASQLGMTRATALAMGTFLWRTGRIHHVLRDAAFDDGFFFFRIGGTPRVLQEIDLRDVEAAMHALHGVQIVDRSYMGKTYPHCFVGGEAVEWMRRRYRLTTGEAEAVGQALLELGELHHVLDEHGFVAEGYFYRFRADEVNLGTA